MGEVEGAASASRLVRLTFDLQRFAESSAGEKTEPATPKKREDARKKGQVARTQELGSALGLLAGVGAIALLAGFLAERMMNATRFTLTEWMRVEPLTQGRVIDLGLEVLSDIAWMAVPIMGFLLAVGFVSQVIQVGVRATAEPLKPKLNRLNPIEGFKRILSRRALVELLKGIFKVVVIGLLTWLLVRSDWEVLLVLMTEQPPAAVAAVGRLVLRLCVGVGAAMIVLSIGDYFYQRWEFEKSIRMTKKEVKDEMKEMEGDPQIRAQLRRRRQQLLGKRMIGEVLKADVVITNPIHFAVALEYRPGEMEAPRLLAKGAGAVAERIKAVAGEHDIPVVENPPLARALFKGVEMGEQIPAELYQAVAEVLAYVFRVRRRSRRADVVG